MRGKADRLRVQKSGGAAVRGLVAAVLLLLAATMAQASGPRWVGGTPFFWPVGFPVSWYTTSPLYYTDPGDLSASVPHAAADALVAQAAAVWNVPSSSLVLAQGGALNEHVTGASITSGGSVTMPADVQSSNWQSKPIAVIYDTDGSVIDALLGAGGSDPAGCLQNAVIESVDSFAANSTILHAILLVNGRCTGSAPEQQLQLKYQLIRAFGRVLGLGWSQTNDNVFTRVPLPSYTQAEHWPIMHPIDILCGSYSYQCLPDPFTLRPDDLSSLAQLYYIAQGQGVTMPGKEDSLARGSTLDGWVQFPDGTGMEGVNITARRHAYLSATVEDWEEVSAVSGHMFRRLNGTPIAGLDGSAMSSIGYVYGGWEGYWRMERIPMPDTDPWQTMIMTTSAVNPLYTGPYALTTQASSSATMAPSGSPVQFETDIAQRYFQMRYTTTLSDGVNGCNAGADGTEGSPATMAAGGWWTGVLCGYGHSSWYGFTLKPYRTATIEVTALNEMGQATAVKAMPMVGVWRASDATGQAPTVVASPVSFNSAVIGMSAVRLDGTATGALRMVVTDQRGAGRPDFAYQGRVFYGDSVQPANVSASGGSVVISGMGFRAGNQVFVNGVQATVTAVTASTITATVPTLTALGSTRALLATITINDMTTGAVSTMTQALGYGSAGQRLQLVTSPSGSIVENSAAITPFALRLVGNDGSTPVAGASVTIGATTGGVLLGACGAASCVMTTDASGLVSTTVTPLSLGSLVLKGTSGLLSATAGATVVAPDVLSLVSAPSGIGTVGLSMGTAFSVRVLASDGVTPRSGLTVTLSADNGAARLEACGASSCSLRTDATGTASSVVTPLAAGTVTLRGNGAAGAVSASFTAGAATLRLVSAPVAPVLLGSATSVPFAIKVVGGDGATPVVGQAVVFSAMGGALQFGACGGASCTVTTDGTGVASSTVIAMAGGPVTLTASAASGSATATFVAGVKTLVAVTLPSGVVPVGSQAPVAMAVKVLAEDGVTPVVGETVQFATTAGSALLGACGGSNCTVLTNAAGVSKTTVAPRAAGTVTVVASATEGSETATLTGQALPDVLQVTSAPTTTVYVGDTVSPGVAVRLLLADGTTPVAGQSVTFAVTGGAATLGVCGGASCTVTTDAQGMASTTLLVGAAGAITIQISAAASTRAAAVTVPVAALTKVQALTLVTPVLYVAEGQPASWTARAALSDNSAAVDGVLVRWTGSSALVFAGGSSAAVGGIASMDVHVAGLGAGVAAQGTVCAWTALCQTVAMQGVGAAEWQIGVVSGAGQQVSGTAALAAVVLRLTDSAGHPVLAVPVSVQQTVTGYQQACPTSGRCPNPPILRSSTATVTTDASGEATVTPMSLAGGEVLQVSLTAGTQGAATISMERTQ